MGFTGPKALQFKLSYIEAFNAMEKELKSLSGLKPAKPRRSASELNARSTATTLRMMARLKCYPEPMKGVFLANAAHLTSGLPLDTLLPPVAGGRENWKSPTQLGEILGRSSNAVGKTLKALAIHGDNDPDHKFSEAVWNKSQHSSKQVASYLYNPTFVLPKLREAFNNQPSLIGE